MEQPEKTETTPPRIEKSPSPGKAERQKFKRERPGPYPKGSRGRAVGGPPFNRVLVTNIPYEEKWQALKDLFRQKIGEVTYVELFTDENGRSRGYGVIEFRTKDLCEEAVKSMNKHEILGRKIIVKEDYNGDLIGRVLRRDGVVNSNNRPSGGPAMPPMPPPMRRQDMPPVGVGGVGLPNLPRLGGGDALDFQKVFQRNGGGVGPIGKTIFVANLDYKVTYAKLKEVFSLAGRILKVDLLLDKDNKSRGMATITFEDPMDAAQAISMLNGQLLFDRPMVVKMDKDNNNRDGFKLPAGLSGIGPTLSARHRSVGDFGPFKGPGGVGDLAPNPAVGILGGGALAGLSALTQQATHLNDTIQSNPLVESRNTLGLASLAGLSDLSRLASMGGGREPSLDQRFLEDRARLIAAAQAGLSSATDRERIDMDIARVDSRIRDINRTIVDRGRRTVDLPPMPPPMNMNMARNNGNNGGMMNMSHQRRGCTVFVRNLAYTITWQQLRERFSRCGSVMFADIKMDNQGKSRGFGYVRFEEPDQAMGAVRMFEGADWEGRKLAVELKPENRD